MDIVHIAVGDYPRYEALLLQRDQIRKDAQLYRRSYIRDASLNTRTACCDSISGRVSDVSISGA